MSTMQRRNHAIDLAKYIASLMVVAIHSKLFADVDAILNFGIVNIICRLAVPFFAVCTGYFLGTHFQFGNDQARKAKNSMLFIRQWKKIFCMYALWTIIFLFFSIPGWIESGWFSLLAFIDYAVATCIKGSYYHLWYLLGMLYVLPVLYIILEWIPRRYWSGIVIVSWIFKVWVYAYLSLIFPAWQREHILSGLVNAVLCLLPLLLVGVSISQQVPKSKRFCWLGFAGNFLMLFIEAYWLRNHGLQAVSYIVFTLPTAYFLFQFICQLHVNQRHVYDIKLAEISMLVYCVHPICISILDKFTSSSVLVFIFCAIASTIFGYCCSLIKAKLIRKKVISCFN